MTSEWKYRPEEKIQQLENDLMYARDKLQSLREQNYRLERAKLTIKEVILNDPASSYLEALSIERADSTPDGLSIRVRR